MNFKKLFKDLITLDIKSFKSRFHNFLNRFNTSLADKLIKYKVKSLYDIPVIINNRNRFTYLTLLVQRLEGMGYKNIYIIDNDSSYPPLLKYYESTPHTVFKLGANVGYLALWQTNIFNKFKNSYYIYTDSDVVPDEDCPDDFINFFYEKLQKYKGIKKIGFGLKIDDLPDHYGFKTKVTEWENQHWQHKIEENIFEASIDTTFALYRPGVQGGYWARAYRTGYPYVAKHMPWYENTGNPEKEDLYYIQNIEKGTTHWTLESASLLK